MKEYIAVNSNNLITSFVWSGLLDKAKCGELLEIIKQCSVEIASIEVLQEIRQEISEKAYSFQCLKRINGEMIECEEKEVDLEDVLSIIDSHISALRGVYRDE